MLIRHLSRVKGASQVDDLGRGQLRRSPRAGMNLVCTRRSKQACVAGTGGHGEHAGDEATIRDAG